MKILRISLFKPNTAHKHSVLDCFEKNINILLMPKSMLMKYIKV